MKLHEVSGKNRLELAQFFLVLLQKAVGKNKLWFMDDAGNVSHVKSVETTDTLGDALYVALKLDVPLTARAPKLKLIRLSMLSEFWEVKKDKVDGETRLILQRKTNS